MLTITKSDINLKLFAKLFLVLLFVSFGSKSFAQQAQERILFTSIVKLLTEEGDSVNVYQKTDNTIWKDFDFNQSYLGLDSVNNKVWGAPEWKAFRKSLNLSTVRNFELKTKGKNWFDHQSSIGSTLVFSPVVLSKTKQLAMVFVKLSRQQSMSKILFLFEKKGQAWQLVKTFDYLYGD